MLKRPFLTEEHEMFRKSLRQYMKFKQLFQKKHLQNG